MLVQPPSGGCVLKLMRVWVLLLMEFPAAFGRLCVETTRMAVSWGQIRDQPPSGGCVLKHADGDQRQGDGFQPPSGGCVLKLANAD